MIKYNVATQCTDELVGADLSWDEALEIQELNASVGTRCEVFRTVPEFICPGCKQQYRDDTNAYYIEYTGQCTICIHGDELEA
jgi:hypothetical protein